MCMLLFPGQSGPSDRLHPGCVLAPLRGFCPFRAFHMVFCTPCCKTPRLNAASQQQQARSAPVFIVLRRGKPRNGCDGYAPDLLSGARAAPLRSRTEMSEAIRRLRTILRQAVKSRKGAAAPALIKNRQVIRAGYCC